MLQKISACFLIFLLSNVAAAECQNGIKAADISDWQFANEDDEMESFVTFGWLKVAYYRDQNFAATLPVQLARTVWCEGHSGRSLADLPANCSITTRLVGYEFSCQCNKQGCVDVDDNGRRRGEPDFNQ